MVTAKVDGVTSSQVLDAKGWHGDDFSLEVSHGRAETREVGGGRENGEVSVAAKLRCAV